MIVADTSAMLALLDVNSPDHEPVCHVFDSNRDEWLLPWATLPELDYMVMRRGGPDFARMFRADVAENRYSLEWGLPGDVRRAVELDRMYRDLNLGLVDGVVMAVAERLGARAIVTLDLRDFGAVELKGNPQIWPRDLGPRPAA